MENKYSKKKWEKVVKEEEITEIEDVNADWKDYLNSSDKIDLADESEDENYWNSIVEDLRDFQDSGVDYILINDDESDDEGENEYIDKCNLELLKQNEDDEDDEFIDPLETKKDAWGNYYTVGGQMWENRFRKRDD